MMRLARFFTFASSAPRLGIAWRSAVSIGLSVLIAWGAGHFSAGLIATIGAFTALYGSDRPYLQRAFLLACVVLALTTITALGVASQHVPWAAVPLVAIVATVGTYLCNALKIGPGAYMVAMAAAVATALPQAKFPGATIPLAVALGGAVSWGVHMAGALLDWRGPEKAAFRRAAKAVDLFLGDPDAAKRQQVRHAAASALHDAWNTLISFQPNAAATDRVLRDLRARTHALHRLFADGLLREDGDRQALAERARVLGDLHRPVPDLRPVARRTDLPLGRPGLGRALMGNLVWGLPALTAAVRVGLAVIPTGLIGLLFGVSRAYWAMAAAVLVLHQGLDWVRTVDRGLARIAGTFIGLGLAFLIIVLSPTGLWIALVLMLLQFGTEMIVTRNYGLATVLITASAITMATGGQAVPHLAALLWSRGFDTFIGCAVGLAVFWATARWVPHSSVRRELRKLLTAARDAATLIANSDVTDRNARQARQDLQVAVFRLGNAYETRKAAFLSDERETARLWPAVAAAERIGYRILALAWALEDDDGKASAYRDEALLWERRLRNSADTRTDHPVGDDLSACQRGVERCRMIRRRSRTWC